MWIPVLGGEGIERSGKVKNLMGLLMIVLMAVGCTTTEKAAAVGALGGATIGGIIGHQSGHGLGGAAVGAAVGGLGGMVVGEKMQTKFCPVCGKTYTSDTEFCPEDGTELKIKQ